MLSPLPLERPALTPATINTLNIASNAAPVTTRKRRYDDAETNRGQSEIFTAKFLATKTQTSTFASVTLLARACLPLAWLNTSQCLPGTVFEANIPTVHEWEQRVLIVRKVPNEGLHAIEKVGRNTYVACALHNWVPEQWCQDAAIGLISECKIEDLLKK